MQLIDLRQFGEQYDKAVSGTLTVLIQDSIKHGMTLVAPKNPHKDEPFIPPVVSLHAIEWLKSRIAWAANEIGETMANELALALSEGYKAGESMLQIAERVRQVFDMTDGRATMIARTETIAASNIGAREGYREAGVQKTQWYTALDERVCPLCDTLHGQINPMDAGDTPPAHPDCRCVLLPVLD